MMSKNSDNLSELLEKLGLSIDEQKVFKYLLKAGTASALDVSRKVKVARTTVYRALENLRDQGLVIEEQGRTGRTFSIAPKNSWSVILAKRESELAEIRDALPKLEKLTNKIIPKTSQLETRLYKGRVGVENALWGLLSSDQTMYTYVTNDLNAFISKNFAELWRRELAFQNMNLKELTNESEVDSFSEESSFVKDHWEIRYLKPSQLNIIANVFLTDEKLLFLEVEGDQLSAVEIINLSLLKLHRSLFDLAWVSAQPMLRVDAKGKSILVKSDL